MAVINGGTTDWPYFPRLCEYSTAKKAVASDYGLKPDRSAFGGLRSH